GRPGTRRPARRLPAPAAIGRPAQTPIWSLARGEWRRSPGRSATCPVVRIPWILGRPRRTRSASTAARRRLVAPLAGRLDAARWRGRSSDLQRALASRSGLLPGVLTYRCYDSTLDPICQD